MTLAGFRPTAFAEVGAAYAWYEEQRPGLGDEFVAAVDAAIASVLSFPEGFPAVHRGARHVLLERFPYGLLQDQWDQIASLPEDVELTQAQRAELELRLRDHRLNRRNYKTWEEFRSELETAGHDID